MKGLKKWLVALCVLLALALSACGGGTEGPGETPGPNPPAQTVVVTAKETSITIKDIQVSSYDYTQHFSITADGNEVEVLPSYIDSSKVSEAPGSYAVTCTYEGKSDSLVVQVTETVYTLTLAKDEVSIKLAEAEGYPLKDLFTATADGLPAEITADMIETDFKAEIGDYTYTVNFHGHIETLTIHVLPDHDVELVLSYPKLELPVNEIETFDMTSLFSLYVDGEAIEVTADMVDASALLSPEAGKTYEVLFSYEEGEISAKGSASVSVIEAQEITIEPHNIETYPNGAVIDLTTLFTIRKGNTVIPVTIGMIEGSIDYSAVGANEIVCTYEGKSATAIVTVRRGVVISYAAGDTVLVKQGTDKRTYPFASDFVVMINGTRFTRIPDSYLDVEEVDFSEEGTYTAKISIPYATEQAGWGEDPAYEYTEKEITYVVRSSSYTLTLVNSEVVLAAGTKSYDPFRNIKLVRDGRDQSLTAVREYVNAINTYAEVLTPIDFDSVEMQTVRIAVYVFGVDREPVEVSFTVRIDAGISLEAIDRIAFTGATLYTRDLFKLTQGGEEIPVTDDMLYGKVNTFVPGVYEVTLNYRGLTAVSRVVVYSRDIIGTYRTGLTTIPEVEEEDDEGYGDSGWGDGGDDWSDSVGTNPGIMTASLTPPPAGTSYLPDLVIGEDGSIRFNNLTVYSATGLDEHTFLLKTGSGGSGREYTLYYYDGIVVLDVENNIRMEFNDYARPLVYFKTDLWSIEDKFTVNYGDYHVLQTGYSNSYSLDTFHVKSLKDESELWYGLYIRLVDKSSSDTVYEVRWGEVEYAEGFERREGAVSSCTFDGTTISFTVQDTVTAKENRPVSSAVYPGINFQGTIDGKDAQLRCDTLGHYRLYIGGAEVFHIYPNDLSSLHMGGVLPGDRLFFYSAADTPYSYYFLVDPVNETFVLEERDPYFGKYAQGSGYFYLSGYGTGIFYDGNSSTDFTYKAQSGEIGVTFVDASPQFAYGKSASFYIAPLLNVLTVKSAQGLSGDYVNTFITDGAIVTVADGASVLNAGSSATAFRNLITILTKDGEMGSTAKKSAIDMSAVDFGRSGFYQYTITVTVGGQKVTSYYALQVLGNTYANSPVIGSYATGAINPNYGLVLDQYGTAKITAVGATYTGVFTVYEDNSFSVKAYSVNGALVTAVGRLLDTGILEVVFDGAVKANEYFVLGSARVASGSDGTLRRFTVGAKTTYVLCQKLNSLGEIVEVTVAGDVYTITLPDGTSKQARVSWDDTSNGFAYLAE